MNKKGQLSLELLLLTAGFVFVLALLVPVAVKATHSAFYAVEVEKATSFLTDLKLDCSQVSIHAAGTTRELSVPANSEWALEVKETLAELKIKNEKIGLEKTITTKLPSETLNFSASLNGKEKLLIEKNLDNSISISEK